ncbi:ABC transporter substrate-binding protein [Thauera sp. SDU_THAU2]|uniref:ABC transporter substrate-binding protein n=1 Tax=Thauera sp. SDU_THAU2 TaxID=3136633 RepID=UPI00311E9772
MMNLKHLAKSLLVSACISASAFAAHAEVKTLTDISGQQVTLDLPAKRVALGFYFEDYMAVAGEQGWTKVVGISKEAWKGWRPTSWKLYTDHMPAIDELPDMGEVEIMTFSVEKVIELKPDVLVLAEWQVLGLGSDVDQIKEAGIPIVVVDYNAQKLENHLKSTELFGEIAGQPDRAAAINKDYKDAIDDINARLAKAGLPKPKAYAEFGNKGPGEVGFTYGKNMWGGMIEQAGGINIAKPFVEWWGPINPEQILASMPDVVFITGTEGGNLSKTSTAMRIGQGVDRKESAERLAGYTKRPGWDALPAVKNKRLHALYQGASRTQADYTMVQYIAKALYPEVFADLNPEQNYIDFYKKYLPVVPQGTFATNLDGQ